jgi:glucose/arabinose dehydrogenase
MRTFGCLGMIAALAVMLEASPARAAISGLQLVNSGPSSTLTNPVFATYAPGERDRLYVVEKSGNIKILDLMTNTITGTFLNISDTDQAGEGGLLGLAFHPNYFGPEGTTGSRKFYVYVTVDNGGIPIDGLTSPFSSRVREYAALAGNYNVADPSTKKEIISWVKPQSNHNGGWIGFNPVITPGEPQYLYITSGDGGKQGDPDNNAQTITDEKLGKILRIDIDDDTPMDAVNYDIPSTNPFVGVTGDDEIWAYGFRNPWRASFDRDTGNFWIGDVGQNAYEEVDRQLPNVGGINYGWRYLEGTHTYGAGTPPANVLPVYDYGHGSGDFQGNAVAGGYVYRGPDPDLQGLYFFADSESDNIWTLNGISPPGTVDNLDDKLGTLQTQIDRPVAYGEDAVGNLFILDIGTGASGAGQVWRILTNKLLPGDYDQDGDVDNLDYALWRSTFGTNTGGRPADGNGNGIVDAADYVVWRNNLGATVHDGAGAGSGAAVPELTSSAYLLELAIAMFSTALFLRRPRLAATVY